MTRCGVNQLKPDVQAVLGVVEAHPEGITSKQIGMALPDMDPSVRAGCMVKLHVLGFIRRQGQGQSAVWRYNPPRGRP